VERMSRAQRMLLVYILMKLHEPRVIQQITKLYGGGGGISNIQDASDVDVAAIGDNKILVYKTASSKHEYESKPSTYTDAEAVAAVEAASLTLQNDLDLDTHDLLFNTVRLIEKTAGMIYVRNLADNAYMDFRAGDLGAYNWACLGVPGYFRTVAGYNVNYRVDFKAQNLGSWTTMASLHAGSAVAVDDGRFIISRAGDIIPAADNTYTIGDGATKNPSAVYAHRFVTVGHVQVGTYIRPGIYSDATRPAPGNVGHVIYNTTDGNLNIDDGFQWILPDGTPT
jgi:hypothetical protein